MDTPHTGPDTGPAEDDRDRERRHTNWEPARPGGRGNALSLVGWSVAFLVIILFFFYARQGC